MQILDLSLHAIAIVKDGVLDTIQLLDDVDIYAKTPAKNDEGVR